MFRELNERLEQLTEPADAEELLDLVCECGDASCTARIRVARQDYEDTRSVPTHFVVAPGHVEPGIERVLQKRADYDLIEKAPGIPADVAKDTDPRA
ncbi:MAG: hypothetical protein HOQ03_05075 [Thermoleophilia bacterium]|nr:hypothetical protein [Thermoleophilia bacterium]